MYNRFRLPKSYFLAFMILIPFLGQSTPVGHVSGAVQSNERRWDGEIASHLDDGNGQESSLEFIRFVFVPTLEKSEVGGCQRGVVDFHRWMRIARIAEYLSQRRRVDRVTPPDRRLRHVSNGKLAPTSRGHVHAHELVRYSSFDERSDRLLVGSDRRTARRRRVPTFARGHGRVAGYERLRRLRFANVAPVARRSQRHECGGRGCGSARDWQVSGGKIFLASSGPSIPRLTHSAPG